MLFLDEIHRMSRPAEEMLYIAMEDFRVDVIVGKGPGATAIPLELPPFTLVGATTRAGLLPAPLRDRFGFTGHLEFYAPAELERVLHRSAGLLGVEIDADGARRDRRPLPRHPPDRQPAAAPGPGLRRGHGPTAWSPGRSPAAALEVYEVDERGLDRLDRAVLRRAVQRFGGGPVGLSTLAVAVGEERETVEEVAEPFLVREGLLARTPRGRVATPAAWAHLGLAAAALAAGRPAVRRAAQTGPPAAGRRAVHARTRDTMAAWVERVSPLVIGRHSPRLLRRPYAGARATLQTGARAAPSTRQATERRHRQGTPVNGSSAVLLLSVALGPALRSTASAGAPSSGVLAERADPGAEICTTSGLFGTIVSLTTRKPCRGRAGRASAFRPPSGRTRRTVGWGPDRRRPGFAAGTRPGDDGHPSAP